MRIARLFIRRVAQAVPIVIGITLVAFVLVRLVPGDPAEGMLGARYTPSRGAAIRHSLGLDVSIPEQYVHFMGSVFDGTFGTSFALHQTVGHLVMDRLYTTLLLIVVSGILTFLLAIPLGLLSGFRHDRVMDNMVRVFLLIGFAIPGFLLGIVLLLLFAVRTRLFPLTGIGDGFGDNLYHMLLPGITLAIPFSTVLVRSLRNSTIEVLGAPFITTARLKGISSTRLLFRHVIRNGMTSVVAVFGVNLAFLVGGTVVVEKVFSLPGVGTLLVDSVGKRDYPVVQALVLLFALFVVAVNLITDVVHALIDPRVAEVATR